MVKEKQWQEFDFINENIKIHVEWCPKDFTAYYDSDYGQLRYGLHIMLSCPKKFSQKVLEEDYCNEICSLFIKSELYLKQNSNFLNDFYKECKQKVFNDGIQKQDFVWSYLNRIFNKKEESNFKSILKNFLIEKL
ncbi:MAG: hypothetical protein MJ181_07605 [Treponema sp.]|nr:hypothetical protein [Treponema sp.]